MKTLRFHAAAILFASLLFACSDIGNPSPMEQNSLLVETDVIYAQGLTEYGTKPLRMDIYQAEEACVTLKPLVLIIHGGAFVRGSKARNGWDARARDAARRGYVAAAVDYRLIPDEPVISDEFAPVWADLVAARADLPSNTHAQEVYARGVTAAIEDTVSALRFLAHDSPSERCIDMSRIGIWGGSAGAIAAVHVAFGLDTYGVRFPEPDAVISYWGMAFVARMIEAGDAPILMLHGRDDDRVAVQGSLNLKAEADAASVGAALYIVEGAGHGYSGISLESDAQAVRGDTLLELTLDFLDAHLKRDAPAPIYETVSIQ